MKKTVVCSIFSLAMLAYVASALATEVSRVDLDGDSGTTQAAPNNAGPGPDWERWDITDGDLVIDSTDTLNGANGIVYTVTGSGVTTTALDRGNPPNTEPYNFMYHDSVYTTRDTNGGFGRHYLQFDVTGLDPNREYRVIMYHYDQNNASDLGFMAWSDQNPADWLDANVGAGASYQPGNRPPAMPVSGYGPMTGGWPSNFGGFDAGADHYSSSWLQTSTGGGGLTYYGWSDAQSYSTQDISMANGLRILTVPEPTSLLLLGIGLLGLGICRRR